MEKKLILTLKKYTLSSVTDLNLSIFYNNFDYICFCMTLKLVKLYRHWINY